MIKLVASDLDGTIIDNKNSISQDNLEAINNIQKKNIPLVICTGKTYALSKDICKNLHASFGIFGNGSQIIDLTTGKEIMKSTLSYNELESCFSVLKKYNLHIHAYTENSIISPKLTYMDLRNSILFPDKINFQIVPSVLRPYDKYYISIDYGTRNPTSMGLWGRCEGKWYRVRDYLEENHPPVFKIIISSTSSLSEVKLDLEKFTNLNILHISKTGLYKDNVIDKEYEYLDISPINVTKGSALKLLSEYLNLQKEDILSVGDNLNDIEMFKASNIGAALSNASDQVKMYANYITKNTVENGGFAEAIYKFIPF